MKKTSDKELYREDQVVILKRGRYANADVWRFVQDGKTLARKDFSGRNWLVRNTVGRFLTSRELRALCILQGTGVVPAAVGRTSPFCLVESFCDGLTLREKRWPDDSAGRRDADRFCRALEEGVKRVHASGFVHLDLHNARNVMCSSRDEVVIIDWQSAISTRWLPRPLRQGLQAIDLAGVCKIWKKHSPGTLGESRKKLLTDVQRWRRLWPFRGYPLASRKREAVLDGSLCE